MSHRPPFGQLFDKMTNATDPIVGGIPAEAIGGAFSRRATIRSRLASAMQLRESIFKGGPLMNHAHLSHHPEVVANEIRLLEQETSLRILLAEDDAEMRRLLALVLRRDGHQVVEARDGGELLEALAWTLIDPGREDFDLVICEQSLPGVPGLTVLEALRARDRTTSFILITRNAGVALRARGLDAFVLDRPFDVQAIRSAIRESAEVMRPAND